MDSNSSSHSSVWMLNSMVREALVTSVTCSPCCVRFQTSQLSTVPKASLPWLARSRAPGTLSSIQRILVAEKYESIGKPVFSRTMASRPRSFSSSQKSAVRRSCQTMALYTGRPVSRSQTMVVSRWLVMPMAAIDAPFNPACVTASAATPACVDQISCGSCSTQPGCGYICGNSFCATETMLPARSNNTARELVVP